MSKKFDYQRLVIGYHGCDRKVGEQILLGNKTFSKSQNSWDWLGHGIYFWEHGPNRAKEFAIEQQSREKVQVPFVIGAHIHLGLCFDLTDTAATKQLPTFYECFKQTQDEAGKSMPVNRPPSKANDPDLLLRYLDCAVLNFGLKMLEEDPEEPISYDTVRGVFPEGEPAYPGAKILRKTHVQIAVRNLDCILGVFRPIE